MTIHVLLLLVYRCVHSHAQRLTARGPHHAFMHPKSCVDGWTRTRRRSRGSWRARVCALERFSLAPASLGIIRLDAPENVVARGDVLLLIA
jgi:hypothetical protein